MEKEFKFNRLFIGALGGSGTRAVAKIIQKLGIYIGDDLNVALDNLIFTKLFKDPSWYKCSDQNQIEKRIAIFDKIMTNRPLSYRELKLVMFSKGKKHLTFKRNSIIILKLILRNFYKSKERSIWGTKEPNTLIFIEDLLQFYPDMKYIYVIRNGLDMAFSSNKGQLHNWGWLFKELTNKNNATEDLAVKQLDYWILSSKKMEELRKKYPQNIFILNHTSLCINPESEIKGLIEFLELSISENLFKDLINIPKKTNSLHRYKKQNLGIFTDKQLKEVKSFGFEVC